MAGGITFGQLRVKCRFKLLKVLECGIHAVYGEHIRAEIRAEVKRTEAEAALTDISEDGMIIFGGKEDDNGGMVEEILFAGVIRTAEITVEGEYAVLSLQAVSYTCKMDIEKKSRSFQNLSMTYMEAAEGIVREYGGRLVWNLPDRPLDGPLIQYKETDYMFLGRMLSHMGRRFTAGDSLSGIYLHAGVRDGNCTGDMELKEYKYSTELFCGRTAKKRQEKRKRGYRIEDTGFLRVGDSVRIQGNMFYVMEAHTSFTGGVLKCDCLVFPLECFRTERLQAETLKGAVLTGKVLETGQELVKLHLDIDRIQPAAEAYEFPWKPITGNLMYCMPEAGTKAALYFGRPEEAEAAVIYSIRENGEECGETADFHDRYFTSDGGRRRYLKPSEMGLLNLPGRNGEVALKDGAVLDVKTIRQMSILAEGQVQMTGKKVILSTPKEATLVRKDLLSPTVINLCNAFDAIGKKGNFAAAPQEVKKKKKRAMPSQTAEEYPMDGLAGCILSSIPAEDFGSEIMEKAAGSMPAVSRLVTGK